MAVDPPHPTPSNHDTHGASSSSTTTQQPLPHAAANTHTNAMPSTPAPNVNPPPDTTSDSQPQSEPQSASQSQSQPPPPHPAGATIAELPPEALDLATRLFDAARTGDPDGLLAAALERGLGPNMTNAKGDTLVGCATVVRLAVSLYFLGEEGGGWRRRKGRVRGDNGMCHGHDFAGGDPSQMVALASRSRLLPLLPLRPPDPPLHRPVSLTPNFPPPLLPPPLFPRPHTPTTTPKTNPSPQTRTQLTPNPANAILLPLPPIPNNAPPLPRRRPKPPQRPVPIPFIRVRLQKQLRLPQDPIGRRRGPEAGSAERARVLCDVSHGGVWGVV